MDFMNSFGNVGNVGYPNFGSMGSAPTAGAAIQSVNVASGIQGLSQPKPPVQTEEKKNPFTEFFKGIGKALKNTVETIFSLKGVALIAGFLALNFLTGGAIMPLLFAAGIGMGAFQVGQGLLKGDWSKVGEGAFGLGTTFLGAKFDASSLKNVRTGETFSATPVSGAGSSSPGLLDNAHMLAGKGLQSEAGAQQSVYGIMKDNVVARTQQAKSWFG